MKIRKIFAGLAAAVMAASMMSMAAFAAEDATISALSVKPTPWEGKAWESSWISIGTSADVPNLDLSNYEVVFTVKVNGDHDEWNGLVFKLYQVPGKNDTVEFSYDSAVEAKDYEYEFTYNLGELNADAWKDYNADNDYNPYYGTGFNSQIGHKDATLTSVSVRKIDKTQTISTVDITVVAPQPGDEVKLVDKTSGEITYKEPDKTPEVTFASDANFAVADKFYITAYPGDDGDTTPFEGTFESGKDYYVELFLEAKEGYQFAAGKDIALKVNGKTDNFKIGQYYMDESSRGLLLYATVTSETVDVEYTAEKTDGYTYTLGSDEIPSIVINRSIGNDKTFGLFKSVTNGDKELVKDTDFTAESGSLKLALTKAYLNSLAAGDYTFKVAFEDGEAEFKLTVAEAPKTEEPNTEEPKNEEPKTEEPKTEEPKDETPKTGAAAGALAAIALVGGVAVVASRKRK